MRKDLLIITLLALSLYRLILGFAMLEFNTTKFKHFCRLIVQLSVKKDIFFNASAITFNLFICAIPFTLILISILGYVLSVDAAFEELLRYGRELFPSFSFETRSGDVFQGAVTLESLILPLVEARRIFGFLGILILMIFAQGLFHTLKHVFFEVFDIEERRHPVMEVVYNFFAFGVVGGIFLFFTMAISLITLFPISTIAVPFTDVIIELGWVTELITFLIPVTFTPLLFYGIFRYISEKRLRPKTALIAAITYTVLFEIAKFGIGTYLDYAFTSYRYFYQGYTILIIIGIWAFYSAALFVFTTTLARAYRDVYDEERSFENNPYTEIS
jgi:uncharacterized BrkB/YihY/UPF0761 family membrane protein